MRIAGTLNIRIAVVLAATLAAALALLTLSSGTTDSALAAGGQCPNANASARDVSAEKLGKAVECLIGKERNQADRKKLDLVGSIDGVAERHTDVMIAEGCLDHQCGNEKPLKKRIVRSGYPIPGGRYGFSEVTGCSLTPRSMVDAWMESQFHRRQILGEKYRDIGVGADKGNPDVPACQGQLRGVYTVIVAWRRG